MSPRIDRCPRAHGPARIAVNNRLLEEPLSPRTRTGVRRLHTDICANAAVPAHTDRRLIGDIIIVQENRCPRAHGPAFVRVSV